MHRLFPRNRAAFDGTHYKLHGNEIATVNPDGSVTLNSCGWYTATTKAHINDVLARWGTGNTYLYQSGGKWYIRDHNGDPIEFYDGMTLY